MRDLAEVYDAYRTDPAFDHLRTEGIVLVPGEGSPRPRVLICGEAPGATENLQKRPFVGASGQALRSLIGDCARLDPADYFITNTVKYRPPGNRNPTGEEIADSLPYLREEFAALGRPPVILAVGAVAKAALAPDQPGVLAIAGKPIRNLTGGYTWIMVHPAYGLRNKNFRPTMEAHWEAFGDWFRKEYS